jgi:hypothetical protein
MNNDTNSDKNTLLSNLIDRLYFDLEDYCR